MAPSNVRHKAEPARPANTALRVSMCTAPDPAFVASYAPIKSGRGVSAMFQDVRSYAELRRRSKWNAGRARVYLRNGARQGCREIP
jgi:hypothetical protein